MEFPGQTDSDTGLHLAMWPHMCNLAELFLGTTRGKVVKIPASADKKCLPLVSLARKICQKNFVGIRHCGSLARKKKKKRKKKKESAAVSLVNASL